MSDANDVLFRFWAREEPELGPGPIVFVGAEHHATLHGLGDRPLVAVQASRGASQRLIDGGIEVVPSVPEDVSAAAVWVLPDRQQQHARAMIGRAIRAAAPGAPIYCCAPTREGGRRHEKLLGGLLDDVWADSKSRCRLVAGIRPAELDEAAVDALIAEDDERDVLGGAFVSRPGLFSWDRVDPASKMLAGLLPRELAGTVVDLGCGYGWLADAVLERRPAVQTLHVVDDDGRALALCLRNLAARHPDRTVVGHWEDVTVDVPVRGADFVVSNPPFHTGGRTSVDLGRSFLRCAARVLAPEGEAWFVANRQLPYEETLIDTFARVIPVKEEGGFKVFRCIAPRRR